jgi:tRNA nucleotidyltransferase (CCA-adding enzyme)
MSTYKAPRYITRIMDTIEVAGFEAYLVGGCVRDMLLGRSPSDWDIASSAPPQEIMRIFKSTVPTGLKYGTVTVLCGEGRAEVTSYRSESGYRDFRRPSEVRFAGDIKTDLSRRDFTVNAMAFNPSHGLFDPFDGRGDIERRMIRAVGAPAARFEEDALRILRAYRFAAQIGFEIESGTLKAAGDNAGLVAKISGERIKCELDRILMSGRPQWAFALAQTGALGFLGLNRGEIPITLTGCGGLALAPAVSAARWAAFLYIVRIFDPRAFMEKLRFDTLTKEGALCLLRELEQEPVNDAVQIKKRLSAGFTPEQYEVYLNLRAALLDCDVAGAIAVLHRITAQGEPYSLRMLAVNGGDIMSLGVPPGPMCGRMLAALLDKVIGDPSLNDRKTLICLAKQAWHVH